MGLGVLNDAFFCLNIKVAPCAIIMERFQQSYIVAQYAG